MFTDVVFCEEQHKIIVSFHEFMCVRVFLVFLGKYARFGVLYYCCWCFIRRRRARRPRMTLCVRRCPRPLDLSPPLLFIHIRYSDTLHIRLQGAAGRLGSGRLSRLDGRFSVCMRFCFIPEHVSGFEEKKFLVYTSVCLVARVCKTESIRCKRGFFSFFFPSLGTRFC